MILKVYNFNEHNDLIRTIHHQKMYKPQANKDKTIILVNEGEKQLDLESGCFSGTYLQIKYQHLATGSDQCDANWSDVKLSVHFRDGIF